MEKRLSGLFDFQRFAPNKGLQAIIEDTESRYRMVELDDSEMEMVAAAGKIPDSEKSKIKCRNKKCGFTITFRTGVPNVKCPMCGTVNRIDG